ncbi:MAG: hypothetical protein HZA82_07240 [Thaumarchaeota archaeon]|nr:hypothetical protein [Nitrososphaerota archaeon]
MTYKTTKTTKTVLFSALMLTLMVPVTGINVADAVDENVSSNALTARPEIPAAPDVLGCYQYTKGTGWVNTACRTQEEMKDLPRPTIGGTSGVRGLRDSTSDIQSYGLVDVQFSTYSGETDSGTSTSNTWSIQTNTNQWQNTGSTNWYIVQFTEQNHSTVSSNRVACVWQINVSTQTYVPNCIAVPLQTLSSSYHGSVEGKVLANGNLQTQYCNIGSTTQCWVVVTTDTNQLGTHWRDTSGTILGLGNGSTANFVSPTSVTTQVKTGPAQAATTLTDFSTAERNNMIYGTSSTSCASNICTRTSPSSN